MLYKGVPRLSEGSIVLFYWPRALKLTRKSTGYSERVIKATVIFNTYQKWHRSFFRASRAMLLLGTTRLYIHHVLKECNGAGLIEKVEGQKAWNVTNKGNDLNMVFNRFMAELMNNEDIYQAGFDPTTHRKRPKGRKNEKYYSTTVYKERNKSKRNVTD